MPAAAPPSTPPRTTATQAVRLAIASLKRTFRRRVRNSPSKLEELVESLRTQGQLAPIHVAADLDVIDGDNRLTALEVLGETEVWAIVHEAIVCPEQKLAAFLGMENGKSSRSVLDVAFPVDALRRERGLTWDGAAKAFRISAATASRYKRVTEAPDDVLAALRAGVIGLTELVEVMRADPARRSEVLRQAVDGGLDAKGIRALVHPRRGGRRKPVRLAVGGVTLEVPADMSPDAIIETLRTKLFAACSRAGALNLGVESLPRIILGLGK